MADSMVDWIGAGYTAVVLLNCLSGVIMVFAMQRVHGFKAMTDQMVSDIQNICATSVRIGIGPTAKKATDEYAQSKPEFASLLRK